MILAPPKNPPPYASDVEELSLLVPSWQIGALAQAAELEGLTVAQFVRRLLNKVLGLSPNGGKAVHSA